MISMMLVLLGPGMALGQLAFQPAIIDLGDVKAGQVFAHSIQVTNTTSSAITVNEIKSSCGCIRPVLEPSTLAPGATGTLKLDINTLASSPGPSTFGVKLRYPEANQIKEQQFIITGRIIQELVVTPTAITCYGEKPRPQTITILDKRATVLQPVKLERTSPYLNVEWVQPVQASPQPQYALQVSVREDLPAGRHEHEVIVYTSDTTYPVLRVPITIVKKSKARFVVSPYLVTLSAGVSPTRNVTIRDQAGEGVLIDRMEASPGVQATLATQNAASVTLTLSLVTPLPREAPFDAEVRVYLKGQPEPVKVLVNVE
jgi:P pilus assembly chaperone PapD